jgi:hypothetical protein
MTLTATCPNCGRPCKRGASLCRPCWLMSRAANAETLSSRFWAKVDRRGPDECWPWTGDKTRAGYGLIRLNGRRAYAHRVSWELSEGLIPFGFGVFHRCDNPPCVNPGHLFTGTHADNMRDMVAKGRRGYAGSPGERHPAARLSAADVASIREADASVRTRDLAARYGISTGYAYAVRRGHGWDGVGVLRSWR